MPKKYSDEYKRMVLGEVEKSGSVNRIANKYKLNYSLVYKWMKLQNNQVNLEEKLSEEENRAGDINDNNGLDNLLNENIQLKDLILKKEMEIQKLKVILRELI